MTEALIIVRLPDRSTSSEILSNAAMQRLVAEIAIGKQAIGQEPTPAEAIAVLLEGWYVGDPSVVNHS
jgi:hypothetical protein